MILTALHTADTFSLEPARASCELKASVFKLDRNAFSLTNVFEFLSAYKALRSVSFLRSLKCVELIALKTLSEPHPVHIHQKKKIHRRTLCRSRHRTRVFDFAGGDPLQLRCHALGDAVIPKDASRRRAMGSSTVGSFDAVCRARRTRKASSIAAAFVIFTAVEAS